MSTVAAGPTAVQHYQMRRLVISALLLALLPLRARAQQVEPPHELSPKITPAFGVHYGNPARISVALGVIVDVDRRSHDGILLLVEPGQKAAEASVGYLRMIGRYGSGFSVRGAVMRTGDDPWDANSNSTYVGAEFHWMVVLGVGGRAGAFRRVAGEPGSHDGIVTLGLALGI
jgi:hypothetical protein